MGDKKKEKKLLKAAKKLEKATKKFMEELTEVDEIFQSMPTKWTRRYNLEEKYFKVVPIVASASIKFELLYSYLLSEIDEEYKSSPVSIWDLGIQDD